MDKTIHKLEFDKIKTQLSHYCACSLGKDLVEKLSMYQDQEEVKKQLGLTDEAMRLVYAYGTLPMGGVHDIGYAIKKAKMDGLLYPQDLLAIFASLEAVTSIKNYQADIENQEVPCFNELVDHLQTIKPLAQSISSCIDYDGSVKDSASSTLYGIRRRIRTLEASIRTKMNQLVSSQKEYLSEAIVTTRNDRFVLPVKTVSKGHVKGIVHAESSSSHTSYIEPESVVRMNNQITEEKNNEQEEIENILFELSQKVKANALTLEYNQEDLQILDFMFAKGAYAKAIDGQIATITDDLTTLSLKQARHPLIDPDQVVANDIELQAPYCLLLITGSNTGGKTVTLKTTGLLAMMALSGLAIPVKEATIPFYDAIYCDLGDEQSIEQSLSTFSSHIKKIISILDNVTHRSLVLIDEIGSGTDPREGESLAQAILDRLLEYHCHVLSSTHYSGLKKYAQENPNVLYASVEFDLETMKPTYHLLNHVIGQSYAFEISRRLGLDAKIVENARHIKDEMMSDEDRLMETLEKEMEHQRQLELKLQEALHENELKEKELIRKLKEFENRKETLLDQAKEQANGLLEEAKQEIQVVLDDLKSQGQEVKPHHVSDAKHTLEGLKYASKNKNNQDAPTLGHEYAVGERVKILSVNREGVVQSVSKKGLVVSLGGLKMQLKENEVAYIGKPLKPKVKSNGRSISKQSTGHYEINVIGMRYEEAMRVVDKFLDDALVNNYPHVRIVHGMGTGVLRKGIRKMLEKNKNVVSFRDGGPNEGGLGATLVYFE